MSGSMPETRNHSHRELMELTLTRIFDDGDSIEQNLARLIEFICAADSWESGAVWLADDRTVVVAVPPEERKSAMPEPAGRPVRRPSTGPTCRAPRSRTHRRHRDARQ